MQTFTKNERLSDKKLIEKLYAHGNSFAEYPFKVIWLTETTPINSHLQVLISVPKRIYKRAIDRNRIKRTVRESYRIRKEDLFLSLQKKNLRMIIMFIFTSKTMLSFHEVQNKIILILHRLNEKINE